MAGGFENDPAATDVLVNEACIDIGKLIELGADFDKKEDGDYHRTLEGGHGMHRIFHHADSTGFEIETTLLETVKKLPNVTIWENTLVCDMAKTPTGFSFLALKDGEYITANSHFAILATGGIGRVYEYTTNSAIATGDGIAMAYRLGAEIKNLSYIQFHPTAFNDHHTRECFLISEAVRGEGAYLKNCNGERFMQHYDKRLELAPRDVVSHSIIFEANRTGSKNFYLDITHKDPEFIRNRFPMIYKNLKDVGIDMTTDMIPIYPCQHYLMGGIKVDTYAHHYPRPVRLRRMLLHGRSRKQPSGEQLAAGSARFLAPRRRRYKRKGKDRAESLRAAHLRPARKRAEDTPRLQNADTRYNAEHLFRYPECGRAYERAGAGYGYTHRAG